MDHPIYRIVAAEPLGGYRIRVSFDDGSMRDLDLEPVLHGELYGPLRHAGARPEVGLSRSVGRRTLPLHRVRSLGLNR